MDGISAGASVLAFLTIGVQCATVIYSTLSAIKDGPEVVRKVANGVHHLQYILEQLKQLPTAFNDVVLRDQIMCCARDLQDLAHQLRKLKISSAERLKGRIWKVIKTILNEKTLELVVGQITQQAALLSLHLNMSSSAMIIESRDEGAAIRQAVAAVETSIQAQNEDRVVKLNGLQTSVTEVLADHYSAVKSDISSIHRTIQEASSVSVAKTTQIENLVRELRDLIIASPLQRPTASTPGPEDILNLSTGASHGSTNDREDVFDNQEMLDSLDRLSSLVHEKGKSFDTFEYDDRAETVIEDLQTLLKSIRRSQFLINTLENESSTSYPVPNDEDNPSINEHLRSLGRLFGHDKLLINHLGRTRDSPTYTSLIQQTRSYHRARVLVGTIGCMVCKRVKPDNDENEDSHRKQRFVEYQSTFTFLPESHRNLHMIVATTLQQRFSRGSVSISRLSVNRVLPVGSRVFELVRQGKLKELQEMFQRGEASLQDHDEYGASLLFYATRQPETCRFLLDSGLDVDHVALDTGPLNWKEGYLCSILQVESNDSEEDEESRALINKCRRLLLDAGADPTLTVDSDASSFLVDIAAHGALESFQLAWNSEMVRCLANVNTAIDNTGRSAFLIYCGNYLNGYSLEGFAQLLKLGANLRARDSEGNTCLHHCLVKSRARSDERYDHSREFEAIKFLIDNGADPFAINGSGESISDVAYSIFRYDHTYSSFSGDLWDSILQSCDFEISEFRYNAGYPRRTHYTDYYCRGDFEALWEGREKYCPYYSHEWDFEDWIPCICKDKQHDGELCSSCGDGFNDCSLYGTSDIDEESDWETEEEWLGSEGEYTEEPGGTDGSV